MEIVFARVVGVTREVCRTGRGARGGRDVWADAVSPWSSTLVLSQLNVS